VTRVRIAQTLPPFIFMFKTDEPERVAVGNLLNMLQGVFKFKVCLVCILNKCKKSFSFTAAMDRASLSCSCASAREVAMPLAASDAWLSPASSPTHLRQEREE